MALEPPLEPIAMVHWAGDVRDGVFKSGGNGGVSGDPGGDPGCDPGVV